MSGLAVGVDIGGTFTDVVVFDETSRRLWTVKTPSVHADLTRGVLDGLQKAGASLPSIARFVHGTTIATNTVLEGKGARTAVLTTQGFRDVIEIGLANRMVLYRLDYQKTPPLVPRPLRLEVGERTLVTGRVAKGVRAEEVEAHARRFAEAGVEAVAVCFLHSYCNRRNENRAKALLESLLPGAFITTSAEVVPEFREYERFSTTVLNAYVAPPIDGYLRRLERGLREDGFGGVSHIMTSGGGVLPPADAARLPVNLLFSGPAGGVTAAAHLSRITGEHRVITYDMGGTSTDVCLIRNGAPAMTTEGEAFGYPVRSLQVEIESIGAGGGSIAWVDRGSVLAVGPQSAGSDPGPACYGRGGREPTVTDANLLLNRISPDSLHASGVDLDLRLARTALARVGRHFPALDEARLADGIVRIAVARMVSAVKAITIGKGHDPREFTLLTYGGAGPMHAAFIAEELGIGRILIPPAPGNFSALGLLFADHSRNLVRTRISRSRETHPAQIREILGELEEEARRLLVSEDSRALENVTFARSVGLRYLGQWYEIDVPFDPAWKTPADFVRDFHRIHEERYGHSEEKEETEVVNYRVSASVPLPKPDFPAPRSGGRPQPVGKREVYFGAGCVSAPVFRREDLGSRARIRGPAIIEESGATTVLPPSWVARVDSLGDLALERARP